MHFRVLLLILVALVAACDSSTDPSDYRLEIVAGDEQRAGIGGELRDSLRVRVIDVDRQRPVEGVEVVWRAIEGAAAVSEQTTRTDPDGIAAVQVQLPLDPGPVLILAEAGSATATFRLTARLQFNRIATGFAHTCALSAAGKAWCWGANHAAQLGDNTETDKASPSEVEGGTGYVAITAGWNHTCGLNAGGDVFCWGDNQYGQLGMDDRFLRHRPYRVSSAESFMRVSAGYLHTCALTADGVAYCWGSNEQRALGRETVPDNCAGVPCALEPVAVNTQLRFREIAAGEYHTCAIATDDRAYCWGWSSSGEIGNNTSTAATYASPVAVSTNQSFKAIAAHARHTCALTTDGAAWCWGRNGRGEIGQPPFTPAFAPIPVSTAARFTTISTGNTFSCGTTTDGRLLCWGDQHASAGDFSTPSQVAGSDASYASLGFAHACSIFDGEVWCWGANNRGQVRAPAGATAIGTPARISFTP